MGTAPVFSSMNAEGNHARKNNNNYVWRHLVSSECRSAVNNIGHCGTDKHRSRIMTSQRTAWLFGAIRPFISIPLPVLYAESVKTTTEAEAGDEGATLSDLSSTLDFLSLSLSYGRSYVVLKALWNP